MVLLDMHIEKRSELKLILEKLDDERENGTDYC